MTIYYKYTNLIIKKETEAAFLVIPEDRYGDSQFPDLWLPKRMCKASPVRGCFSDPSDSEVNLEVRDFQVNAWIMDRNEDYIPLLETCFVGVEN